jgi:hypothetical protein
LFKNRAAACGNLPQASKQYATVAAGSIVFNPPPVYIDWQIETKQ